MYERQGDGEFSIIYSERGMRNVLPIKTQLYPTDVYTENG